MLLPEHNRSGALRVAARIHAEVSKLPIPTVQTVAGWATVSIGLASMVLDERQARTPNDLYDRADAALNETTATGCNRTYCAEPGEAPGARQQRKLRVVGAT